MLLLPLALCGYLAWSGAATAPSSAYLAAALVVLHVFAATLGLHCGLLYARSRLAIAASLGTLVFLLAGVAACMAILVAFAAPGGGGFTTQLAPFLALVVGGSAGLYFALGARRASAAIGWAAVVCPLATFWSISSYFLDYTLGIFLVTAATYGFTTLALVLPWMSERDLRAALGD
jgi:hypothetical protein